jgi:hypothetical protein
MDTIFRFHDLIDGRRDHESTLPPVGSYITMRHASDPDPHKCRKVMGHRWVEDGIDRHFIVYVGPEADFVAKDIFDSPSVVRRPC